MSFDFLINSYSIHLGIGRLSLTWIAPWGWYDFNIRMYVWSFLPDEEHFWGRILGLEYCWFKGKL